MTPEPPTGRAPLGLLMFLARRSVTESPLTLAMLIGAVCAGIAFQIPNSANFAGYRAELLDHGVERGPGHVRVRPATGRSFEDGLSIAAALRATPGVTGVHPVLAFVGEVGVGGRFRGCGVMGLEPGSSHPPYVLLDGARLVRGDTDGLLMGATLADQFGVGLGDQVDLRTLYGVSEEPDGSDVGMATMSIRGIVGGAFMAHSSVFVTRPTLARDAGLELNAASKLLVWGREPSKAGELAARLQRGRDDILALAWPQDHTFLASAVDSVGVLVGISEAMVIMAVAIPVLALLYITVLRRRKDIGLLCALGFSRGEVFAAFLAQAIVIGLVGAVLGIGVGLGATYYFVAYPIFEWRGFVIEPTLTLASVARPTLVVLATTVLAGALPAWHAARTDPATALKGVE